MIPENWVKNPAYVRAAAEAVGDKRAWQSEGFQTLLDYLVGDQELQGSDEVPQEWVLEISKLVKQTRKEDRKEGRWVEIPARKRWIALAGRALIAMHALTATYNKPSGYSGD